MMKITITIDVNAQETGYLDDDELKDNIVDFAHDLIINGAENEEVSLSFPLRSFIFAAVYIIIATVLWIVSKKLETKENKK